jgi:hypothetical protein
MVAAWNRTFVICEPQTGVAIAVALATAYESTGDKMLDSSRFNY